MIIFEFIKKYKGPFIFFAIVITLFYIWYFLYNMQVKEETEHFIIRCTFPDEKIIDELTDTLEDAYAKITKDLDVDLNKKITVRIYPSMFHYKRGVTHCTWSDTWIFFSSAQFKDIRMMSPRYKKIEGYSEKDYIRSSVHSLVHALMLNNDNDFIEMPMWITEGISVYESNKVFGEYDDYVKEVVKNNERPKFNLLSIPHDKSVLKSINSTPFAKRHGHEFSYTIIDYIVKEFGYDDLNKIIKNHENYYKILGFDDEEMFISQWLQYLNENYLK